MKTLSIIGKVLLDRFEKVGVIILGFLLSFIVIGICMLPGVGLAALFWGTSKEILFTGGAIFLSCCGLIIWIVKAISNFCHDFKVEKNKFDK